MLVLIVIFHNNTAEALFAQPSDAIFIVSDIIKPVSIIIIISMLIMIHNNRKTGNKGLIIITTVVLCAQVILHMLEFWCARQSALSMDRFIIERLLEEMKKQSLGAGS